jgi:hypothetical protein
MLTHVPHGAVAARIAPASNASAATRAAVDGVHGSEAWWRREEEAEAERLASIWAAISLYLPIVHTSANATFTATRVDFEYTWYDPGLRGLEA